MLIGVVALFFNLSATLFGIAFFLIGFGNGPTFPLITHATPFIYGKEKSQSIIGIQMVGCNLGILSMCAISGPLFQLASFYAFPYYAIICYILMISMFVIYQKLIKKQSMSFYKIY